MSTFWEKLCNALLTYWPIDRGCFIGPLLPKDRYSKSILWISMIYLRLFDPSLNLNKMLPSKTNWYIRTCASQVNNLLMVLCCFQIFRVEVTQHRNFKNEANWSLIGEDTQKTSEIKPELTLEIFLKVFWAWLGVIDHIH